MKTNALIRMLQELDPSGELEVTVDGNDIFFGEKQEAYYDGCLQTFIRDPSKKPFYDIVGMRFSDTGEKVVLHALSLRDIILDDDEKDLKFEFDCSLLRRGRLQAAIKSAYEECDEIGKRIKEE